MKTQIDFECFTATRGWLFCLPMLRRLCGIALLGIAVLLFAPAGRAQASDQSLADVARHHKPAHKAARVITNDDIPSVATQGEPSPHPAGSESKELSPTTNSSPAPGAKPSGSAAKNSKAGVTVPGLLTNGTLHEAQTLLENAKHDRQALIDNYDKIKRKLAGTNDESLRRLYSDSLAKRDESLARQDKIIADVESAIHAAQGANAEGDKNETQ
jgi:hypothetical protein